MSGTEQLKQTLEKIHAAIAKLDAPEAVALLKKLEVDEIPSREALQTTKAGAAINKLSKNSLPAVQVAAAAVLAIWKGAHSSKTKRKREDGAEGDAGASQPSGSGEKKVKLEDGKAVKKEGLIKGETNGGSSRSSPAPAQPRKPRSTITKNDPPRTSISDKPDASSLKPTFTDAEDEKGMKFRERGVIMFYDALAFDNREDKGVIANIAVQLEQAVFESAARTTGDAYRSKTRELYMSIKEATNDILRDRIVRGDHSAHDVVNLSQDELKSRAVAAEEEAIDKQNMFEARGAGATEAETDAFKCGKCGQRKTTYYQMQTRSADEPMTTFVTCTNCNNRWKFC